MLVVQRVEVTASLDDPQPTLDRARREAAAGDPSWAQWVEEYEQGEALIVRLDVRLLELDGHTEVVEVSNRGVFVEKALHPPKLEQQIAEMTSKDYGVISAKLRERGYPIDIFALSEMYVHVELDPALLESLRDNGARTERPAGDAALSRPADPPARS